jgi:hypothetical protein
MLVMMSVYFDESGTQASSDVVVVAGWISTDIQWERLSGPWTKVLRVAGLDPPVFHSTDFERVIQDWRMDKRIRVRQRLVTLLRQRTRSHAIAAVLRKPYEKAAGEGLTPPLSALGFATMEALKKIRGWLDSHGKKYEVSYFFEDRPENRDDVVKAMTHIENSPEQRERFRFKTWGWVPKTAPPAQAADMLAYEVWKECVNGLLVEPDLRRYPIRKSLQALTHLVPRFTWYGENAWDAERRKRDGATQGPSSIPRPIGELGP